MLAECPWLSMIIVFGFDQQAPWFACRWALLTRYLSTRASAVDVVMGATARSSVVSSLHEWSRVEFPQACVVASIFLALGGCVTSNVNPTAGVAPVDAMDSVRNTDFSARFPIADEGDSGRKRESTQPFLFPGSDVAPDPQRERDPDMRSASLQQAAFLKGDGVEMNFEGADVQMVAKALLGDILQLNFVVDPRVQGNVTLASAGPIPRKDVLPAFESVLRMSNAAIVRSGSLVKIVPIPEAGAGGAISVGAGEPGFGVSLCRCATPRLRRWRRRPRAFCHVRALFVWSSPEICC